MATCREARLIAQQYYSDILGPQPKKRNIWFHYDVDTLHIKDVQAWNFEFGFCGRVQSARNVRNLKFLTVGISVP